MSGGMGGGRGAGTGTTIHPASSPAAPKSWTTDFVLLAAIWGSSFLFMHIGAVQFGALPTAFVRVAIAGLFLLPLVWWRGLLPELGKHWRRTFFIGLLNSGIPFALFAYALLSITTGLSSILNATVPMFGALIAWVWLRDRPTGWRIVGLATGFAGVALLAWDKASFTTSSVSGVNASGTGAQPAWAVAACLAACVCYGISASYTKRYLAGLPPLVTAAGSQIGASLGLVLPALWLWPARMPGPSAWLALAVVGVVCTGIAYILFFRLIETAGPPRALSVTFVVPVFAVLYGAVFLGESVTLWMAGCALVIVGGTALATGLVTPGSKRRQAA